MCSGIISRAVVLTKHGKEVHTIVVPGLGNMQPAPLVRLNTRTKHLPKLTAIAKLKGFRVREACKALSDAFGGAGNGHHGHNLQYDAVGGTMLSAGLKGEIRSWQRQGEQSTQKSKREEQGPRHS